MKLKIMKIFSWSLIFLFGSIYSASSASKNNNKRNFSDSIEIKNSKKFRTIFDSELVEKLKNMIDENAERALRYYTEEYGAELLYPANTDILKYCVDHTYTDALEIFLDFIESDKKFEIVFETLVLAAPLNIPVIKMLASSDYITKAEEETAVLDYLVYLKDFETIEVFLENGLTFKSWRNGRGQSLPHLIAKNDLLSSIKYFETLDQTDKSGLTPIFYANSVDMVKAIRRNYPGARDFVGRNGKTAWQMALNSRDYELLDAMISFEKRLRKFKGKQRDYCNLPWASSSLILQINRNKIFKDSHSILTNVSSNWYTPRRIFFVEYVGEEGLDAGGVKRDWITNLLKIFFTPNPEGTAKNFTAPVFIKVDDESGCYALNASVYKPGMFIFVGSIVGLALAMNIPIVQKLIPALYRALMHEKVDLVADLQEQSPAIYRSLQHLEDPTVNVTEMELKLFSKPLINVNRRSAAKYIQEYSRDVLIGRHQKAIPEFVSGFESVLPVKVYNYFKYEEFKKVLTGKADYTAEEFMAALECKSNSIKTAMGRLLTELTASQRSRLLKFITGLDALPSEGFSGLHTKLKIVKDPGLVGKLPTSSTCVFTLKVPPFTTYEAFSTSLITAIENSVGVDYEPGVELGDGIDLGFDDEEEFKEIGIDSESEVSCEDEEDDEHDEHVGAESEQVPLNTLTSDNPPSAPSRQSRVSRSRLAAFPDF